MLSSTRRLCLAGLTIALIGSLLVVAEGRLTEKFIWSELQFNWPSQQAREAAVQSEQVSETYISVV